MKIRIYSGLCFVLLLIMHIFCMGQTKSIKIPQGNPGYITSPPAGFPGFTEFFSPFSPLCLPSGQPKMFHSEILFDNRFCLSLVVLLACQTCSFILYITVTSAIIPKSFIVLRIPHKTE